MNIDGNAIVVIAAAVAVLAGLWGAVRKLSGATDAAAKLPAVEIRLTAIELKVALLEQSHTTHLTTDAEAFRELRTSVEAVRVSVDEMKDTLLDVLVKLGIKDRQGRGAHET